MGDLLKFVGLITVITVAIFAIGIGVVLLKEAITAAKWKYKYRHRFSKPPTAKCYCHDCKMWDSDTGKCADHCNSRRMAGEWFCCFAIPKEKEALQ